MMFCGSCKAYNYVSFAAAEECGQRRGRCRFVRELRDNGIDHYDYLTDAVVADLP